MHGPVSRTGAARASDEVQVDARATGAVPHPEARHDADANTDHPPVMMFRGRQGTTAGHRGETLVPTAACRYELPHAKVAELADAQDSGSCGLNTRGGSSPPFRTPQLSKIIEGSLSSYSSPAAAVTIGPELRPFARVAPTGTSLRACTSYSREPPAPRPRPPRTRPQVASGQLARDFAGLSPAHIVITLATFADRSPASRD